MDSAAPGISFVGINGGIVLVKFDILSHELVPKFTILSKEEVEALRQTYGIRRESLPWIRRSDPACKAIGARPGDVLKIERSSEVAGKNVVYRYVVPG
jgi:DNA-directed RNA polymerase subunit H